MTEHSDKRPKTSGFAPTPLLLPHTCGSNVEWGFLRPNKKGSNSSHDKIQWHPIQGRAQRICCLAVPGCHFCLRGHANQLANSPPLYPGWSPPRMSSVCAHSMGAEKEMRERGGIPCPNHLPKPRQQSFDEAKTLNAHVSCASQHMPFHTTRPPALPESLQPQVHMGLGSLS